MIVAPDINEDGSVGSAETEGCYDHYKFTTPPCPPSDEERALNNCPNHVWPDLYFKQAGGGEEGIYVNVAVIPKGTLFPIGGHFRTHWEYLAEKRPDLASVSSWFPIEDFDRDGLALWYVPDSLHPLVFPLHVSVGEAIEGRAKTLNLEIVGSVFPAEGYTSSARLFYRALRDLRRNTQLWGPSVIGFCVKHMWGEAACADAEAIQVAFVSGEKCPHGDDVKRHCIGNSQREDRIYGAFKETFSPRVPFLDVCRLPVSVVGSEAVPASVRGPALGKDLAIYCCGRFYRSPLWS